MKHLSFFLLLIFVSAQIISCQVKEENTDTKTTEKTESVNESESEKQSNTIQIKATTVVEKAGIPMQDVVLNMPNGEELLVGSVNSIKEVAVKDRESNAIPKDAAFALTSFYAGSRENVYGLLENENLKVYRQFVEEDGSKSDVELLKSFAKKNSTWVSETVQGAETADEYRNANWQPEKGKYYFSEQYNYDFVNNLYPTDDPRHKGKFSFFLDKPTGTILLVRYESFMDEMTKYVLIRPGQDYIVASNNEAENNVIETVAMDEFYRDYPKKYEQTNVDAFSEDFKKTSSGATTFGNDGTICIDSVQASKYEVNFQTADKNTLALADVPFDLTNFHLLSKSDAMPEGGLLIDILQPNLPNNKLVVGSDAEVTGKAINFKLTCISATEYFVDLNEK